MGTPNPAPAWWVGRGLGDNSFASDLHWGESADSALSLEKTPVPQTPVPAARFLLVPDASALVSLSVGSAGVGEGT